MKTCITCKHLSRGVLDVLLLTSPRMLRCTSPANGLSPVSGKPIKLFASVARQGYSGCGRDGRNWEVK